MQIQEIKRQLPIKTVLNHYNLSPDKNGMLNCPFHNDKTPSLKIYEKTNTFHCFGCGATGDQIEFIQKKENLTKHQAILKAKELIGSVKTYGRASQLPKNPNKQNPMNENYLKMFTSFKHAILRSPKAKEYAESRHLDINKIEVGYNSGSSYKKMKHCLIFPLKNKTGEIVSFYGRSVLDKPISTSSISGKTGKHYYTAERTGLYPKYPKEETEILILTESIIDAATLLQFIPEAAVTELVEVVEVVEAGQANKTAVLACYGTNGLTPEHKTAIAELPNLKEIIFFFDGDKAGRDAAEKYAEELKTLKNCKISTVQTPDNEDINSLLDGHEPEIFTHLINKRQKISFSSEKSEILENPTSTTSTPLSNQGSVSGNNKNGEADKALVNSHSSLFNPKNPDYITFTTGELQIAILGGINMQQLDRLRVTLKMQYLLNSVRNNIDLYNIDQTDRFISKAAEKLETGTSILNRAISELTDKLEYYRMSKIESQKRVTPSQRELSPERSRRAINYLSEPKLLKRTNADIGRTGVIGEEKNRILMYMIFTSRLREQPLHIISLGSSGTGKTYLQEKISELIPEQDKKEITILSENAFYYFDKTELKHKLVLIEDMDGAETVLYPLRELQSKRKINKTVTVKDSKGNNKTINLTVEGPICLAGTTTKERLYEDNANRSILIYLDNSKEQKEKIMNYQRTLSAGKIDTKKEEEIKEFFKDMQTVLRPVKVINPYAEMLKIPDYVFKPLRTNSHYLAFIETITFYHQYQRPLKTNRETGEKYIETTFEDIENANSLIKDVLLAKSDELTKVVRSFFEAIKYHVKTTGKESFFTKELREKMRFNPMTINRYVRDLESRNYIKRVGGNRKKGFEYEVSNWNEYNDLQKNMDILNEILDKIRQKSASKSNED